MSDKNSANSTDLPQVYKEEELKLMIELIENGLWRTTNLSTALHVDRKTIDEWKQRPEVQGAHRKAILKFVRRRTDTENILKELDVEIQSDPQLTQINNYLGLSDDQLKQLITSKSRQLGVVVDVAGTGETEEREPVEVPETTS
jgi:hypothetical protein